MAQDTTITATHLRQRAIQFARQQRWLQAQAALKTLLQELPDDLPAHLGMAQALSKQGHFRDSCAQLLRAATTPGKDVSMCVVLIQRLCLSGEVVAARTLLQHLTYTAGQSASTLEALANLHWMLGEFSVARELMGRINSVGFATPHAAHFYAVLLQATGEADTAEQVLEACLDRWPDSGDAIVSLSNLRKQTAHANHLDTLKRQLSRLPATSTEPDKCFLRAQFEAALFKELDDLGHYDDAWHALSRSNGLMRKLNPYHGSDEAAVVQNLIETTEALVKSRATNEATYEGPMPIFIVGMPRSGTTLLDRMLSSHSEVTSAGEINDFLRQLHWTTDVPPSGVAGMLESVRRCRRIDFTELGTRYLAQTQWRAEGKRYYIDKLPINIQMVPFIRRALPAAPILHMVREPMDVCFSNLKAMFGNVSAYSYDLKALAHYYGLYRRIADRWHALMPGAMLDVSYAQLVQQPVAAMRQILDYCGLDIEEACLHPERNAAPVATPSSVQVREPIHTRALGQWQHYAAQLEPLRLALRNYSP